MNVAEHEYRVAMVVRYLIDEGHLISNAIATTAVVFGLPEAVVQGHYEEVAVVA